MKSGLEIPRGDGEYVFSPGNNSISSCLKRNRASLHQAEAKIAGRKLQTIRQSLRRKIIKLAAEYSGVKIPQNRGILATGHQPIFYHPGILIKELLLEQMVNEYCCLNFSVDTDVASEISVKVPLKRRKHYLQHQLILIDNSQEIIFGKLNTPPVGNLKNFAQMILDRLETHNAQIAKRTAKKFLDIAINMADVYENYRDWMTFSRRKFLGSKYLNLPISEVWKKEEAKLFMADIVSKYQRFKTVYNRVLEDYQSQYGLFPAAKLQDGELPFWKLSKKGYREKVYKNDLARDDAIKEKTLLPRAITLTLFCRLFLCDLFVHGVGGAKYDRATDRIIEDFYGIIPPTYAYISLTMHLPEPKPEVKITQVEKLEEGLKTFEENPKKYYRCPGIEEDVGTQIKTLTARKNELIKDLKSTSGEEKSKVIEKINEVESKLDLLLSDLKSDLRKELKNLKRELHNKEVIETREYPFFFFPKERIEQAVAKNFK